MIIAVVDSGLFPDRERVEGAVSGLQPHYNLYRCDVREGHLSDEQWDQVLDEILGADRVLVL